MRLGALFLGLNERHQLIEPAVEVFADRRHFWALGRVERLLKPHHYLRIGRAAVLGSPLGELLSHALWHSDVDLFRWDLADDRTLSFHARSVQIEDGAK